jgi:hypothetical protein
MAKVINFYLDDSGTRRPNHDPGKRAAHGYDWFALGGVLVKQEEEESARLLCAEFRQKWPQITGALHSAEVRGRTESFLWLNPRSRHAHRWNQCLLSANSRHPTHDANPTRWRYASQMSQKGSSQRFVSGISLFS